MKSIIKKHIKIYNTKTRAMSLIEIMLVIIIIGILASVVYPRYVEWRIKARLKEIPITVEVIAAAERVFLYKNGNYRTLPNWEADYINAGDDLNVVLPDESAICEYGVRTSGTDGIIDFRRADTDELLGSYNIDNDIYTIVGSSYEEHLQFLN